MIHGHFHFSKECKLLSYFGEKWSATQTYNYHKRGNGDKVQEANLILLEAV